MQLLDASEIEQLLDKRQDLVNTGANAYLAQLVNSGCTDLYQQAISISQSARARSGDFFEKLWSGFLTCQGFSVIEQPQSLSKKRADLCLDNRIVIDTTTCNRERMKNKILYQKDYPDKELHIITGDKKPPSKDDMTTLINSGVHLIVRDSVHLSIDSHPYIHSFSSYVNEIRIRNC